MWGLSVRLESHSGVITVLAGMLLTAGALEDRFVCDFAN
jgi:hypothetical protein